MQIMAQRGLYCSSGVGRREEERQWYAADGLVSSSYCRQSYCYCHLPRYAVPLINNVITSRDREKEAVKSILSGLMKLNRESSLG